MMKAFFLAVVLLFGFASARPKPEKRDLSCTFPKQLSGRLYMVIFSGSGGTSKIDMTFNMDSEQEIAQFTSKIDGQEYNSIMDYKESKVYTVASERCYVSSLDGEIFPTENLKALTEYTSGKLGMKGTLVDVYGGVIDKAHFIITFESGAQCIPVSFGSTEPGSATSARYFDLRTSVDPEKLKIPEHCSVAPSHRRSLTDMIHPKSVHAASVQAAMRRGVSWLLTQRDQKRGFPWTNLQKRGFPWTNLQRRGFPWTN